MKKVLYLQLEAYFNDAKYQDLLTVQATKVR